MEPRLVRMSVRFGLLLRTESIGNSVEKHAAKVGHGIMPKPESIAARFS